MNSSPYWKKIVLMEKKLSQLWTMNIQIIKNYWDMEIIGNRRKNIFLEIDEPDEKSARDITAI